jgi:cytochrome c peroxidase
LVHLNGRHVRPLQDSAGQAQPLQFAAPEELVGHVRNHNRRTPYMHDGSIATLEEAIDRQLYYRGTQESRPIILTPGEKTDLLEFMRVLTGDRAIQR